MLCLWGIYKEECSKYSVKIRDILKKNIYFLPHEINIWGKSWRIFRFNSMLMNRIVGRDELNG